MILISASGDLGLSLVDAIDVKLCVRSKAERQFREMKVVPTMLPALLPRLRRFVTL